MHRVLRLIVMVTETYSYGYRNTNVHTFCLLFSNSSYLPSEPRQRSQHSGYSTS